MIIGYELALILNEILYQQGKRGHVRVYENQFQIFSEEELASVTELTITNVSNIDELVYLPNLRVLRIKGINYNEMVPELDLENNININHITDFSVIEKLTNLEELVIENDLNLTTLNVSKLTELRVVELTNNINLKELKGLEYLMKLENVFICGNSIESSFDFKSYAYNTIMCSNNVLDVSMYLSMINNSKEGAKELVDLEVSGISDFKFAEKSGFLEYTCLNAQSLCDMYGKLDSFFKRSNAYELTDDEKCAFVYRYLLNNISFSERSIIERNANYHSIVSQYHNIPNQFRQNLASIHNSYYAYRFKAANCEGIVNLGVFMLRMLGIEAYDVHCHDLRATTTLGNNHAIIRVKTNNVNSYIDPTYCRSDKLNLFMLSYDEISKYHMLDAYESYLDKKDKRGVMEYVRKNIK